MRKLRIAYYSIFIAFIIAMEEILIGFEAFGKIGIAKSAFGFILYIIPLLVVLPLFCLIQEIVYFSYEKKAIRNANFVKAKFEDMEEFRNLWYRGYKVRVSYIDKNNKKKCGWTQSNFSKNQVLDLKDLREFDIFIWKEKVFIKPEYLDSEGALKKVYKKKTIKK